MTRWSRVLRGWFVVAIALLALALPAGAAAFVPPNPAIPRGHVTSVAHTGGSNWADAGIALGVVAGVVITGLAVGELARPHDHGRHHRLGPVAG